jgi:hypothetical protein
MSFSLHASLPKFCLIRTFKFNFQSPFLLVVTISIQPSTSYFHGLAFHTTWPSNSFLSYDLCTLFSRCLMFEGFQAIIFTFEGWCPYKHLVEVGKAFLFLCFFLCSNYAFLQKFNLSTILGEWSNYMSFTHVVSFNWHPFHLTKYYLPKHLVCFTSTMHSISSANLCSMSQNLSDRLASYPTSFRFHLTT